MAKLQVTGFLTIAKSSELSEEDKAKVLQAAEGKVKKVRAVLVDAEGNEVVVSGRLTLSSKGSLTARFGAKINSFEIVEVDDEKGKSDAPSKNGAEVLAQELLGLSGE